MRIVVDTNVFVSAALKESSWPGIVVRWVDRYGGLLKSKDTEAEVIEVLPRPRFTPLIPSFFLDNLRRMLAVAERVVITERVTELIAYAAKTRFLGAGSIIGSSTVSNVDRSAGSACLAERLMLEIIANGRPSTPFLRFGDGVHIEMFDAQGHSIFDQREHSSRILRL